MSWKNFRIACNVQNKLKIRRPRKKQLSVPEHAYYIFNVIIPSCIEFVLFTLFDCAYIQTLMELTKLAKYNGYTVRISHN